MDGAGKARASFPIVAVAGCGYWGKNLIRVFHELEALAAIFDPIPDTVRSLTEACPGVEGFSSYEGMLKESGVRAVVVASPSRFHFPMAKDALLSGKDVLVEKPLSLSEAEGSELVAIAQEKNRILMVGHLLWYHPAFLKLKNLVDREELGKIRYIYSSRLNFGKIRQEENVLWSFAPHDISMILGLTGEMPSEIHVQAGSYLQARVADVTVSLLSFPSGVKAHIFVSWLHPYKEQKLVVVGEKKMAVFDDTQTADKLILYPCSIDWEAEVPVAHKAKGESAPVEEVEPLRAECLHFLECVRDRKKPRTDGEEGLKVLRVLQRCQESLEKMEVP